MTIVQCEIAGIYKMKEDLTIAFLQPKYWK